MILRFYPIKFKRPVLLLSCVLVVFCLVYVYLILILPSKEEVQLMALGSDRIVLDRNGHVLQMMRTDFSKRRLLWLPLNQFSEDLKSTIIQIEDQRFYRHIGIDPIGFGRAIKSWIQFRKRQGASTITMQLADLIRPEIINGNERIRKGHFFEKGAQILRALALEAKWSKNEILEAYLNLIHLRGETQGISAFSEGYFKKDPLALNKGEAILAALSISSPNASNRVMKRRACYWKKKFSRGEDVECGTMDQMIDSIFHRRPQIAMPPALAHHLGQRVLSENPKSGVIHTTIDQSLQVRVTEILEQQIRRLKNFNVNDGAAIVIENQTGNVLAYVGAVHSSKAYSVDGVRAFRQAGSALKPFFYARALDTKRITAASILLDDPTVLTWGHQMYRPANYDRHFNGPVSVREALASSLNVPAVKIITMIGLHEAYKTLQDIGLVGLKEPDFYGVSMALGAVEVRLEDLANAYRILSQNGKWSPLQYYYEIPINKNYDKSKSIFSGESSNIVGSILSDPNARAIGFGLNSPLETPFWTVVKTGTSKDYRDNWCVGFSDKYTVGVWAGNFDATAMKNVSGVAGAGPVWFDIMSTLHFQTASHPPSLSPNIVSSLVRHPWQAHAHEEFFIKGTEPRTSEIEMASKNRISFIFPSEGSYLIKDPYLDESRIGLTVRFQGETEKSNSLYLDGGLKGPAISPFQINNPPVGNHKIEIRDEGGKTLAQVSFVIKGTSPH